MLGEMIEPSLDDEQGLLMRVASGDGDAARRLIDDTGEIVYGFIYARVGGRQDVAEDLTQATYMEALRSAAGFRGESTLETWLCAIARRQVARHYESERRRERLTRKLRLVAESSIDDEDVDEELDVPDGDALIQALGSLTPLHRQVLVLKYIDGLSVERIAGELGRTRVQIQSLLQRARTSIRRRLEDRPDV